MSSFKSRALELVDLDKGYFEVLSQLSSLGELPMAEVLRQRFDELKANEDYCILIAEDPTTGRVAGPLCSWSGNSCADAKHRGISRM